MPHANIEERRAYFREYHAKNKAKKNAYAREYYAKNPEKMKAQRQVYYANNQESIKAYREKNKERAQKLDRIRWRKKKAEEYGLDLSTLPEVLICEICSTDEGRMAFDHNHTTGKFRGVLCTHCNVALGMAKDNPELLEKMAKYLRDRE